MSYRVQEEPDAVTVVFHLTRMLRATAPILLAFYAALELLWLASFGASNLTLCLSLPTIGAAIPMLRLVGEREVLVVTRETVSLSRLKFGRVYWSHQVDARSDTFHAAVRPRFFSLRATPRQPLLFADLRIGDWAIGETEAKLLAGQLNDFLLRCEPVRGS